MADENCTTKRCSKCRVDKPATLEFFYWNKSRNKLSPRCKECQKGLSNTKYIPKREPKEPVSDGYRRCSHCLQELPATLEWFESNSKSNVGLSWWCRECCNKSRMEAYRKRPKKKQNREPDSEEQKQRNRERAKKPESKLLKRAYNHKYKASKRNAKGSHTAEDITLQFKSQRGKCWHCGKKLDPDNYHVDHLTPLSRGGSNAADNIVITCPFCNLSKHNRLPHEWNGRLL